MRYLILLAILVQLPVLAVTPYTSQAHTGQDKYLHNKFFKNKRNGVFVEIGAHDGISLSNTYFFEKELNWTGVCFEPLVSPFEKLKKNRRCICINSCVSSIEGFVEFLEVDDIMAFPGHPEYSHNMLSGMLHTYDPRHLERLLKVELAKGGSYKITKMPSRRFNNVMKENNIFHIDYLSIDTEGGELEILNSIDFDTFYIYVISVENNYDDPKIREVLTSKGFNLVTNLSHDEIYSNSKSR